MRKRWNVENDGPENAIFPQFDLSHKVDWLLICSVGVRSSQENDFRNISINKMVTGKKVIGHGSFSVKGFYIVYCSVHDLFQSR